MSNMLALLAATGGGALKLYSDDVFCAYTRTGTGATATLNPGIDMTKGYALWSKGRSGATDHAIYDSARGLTLDLVPNSTAAQTTQATGLTAVSTTGYTIGALAKMNTSGATYVDWIFREAANFHKVALVTKSAGSNATVDLSTLGTVGMVRVKRTDAAGSWYVWHRSLSAGKLLSGETTAAEATLGHITVVGTTLTLVNGVIADGTYHVEAYAHDTSADGLIQCGSFTTDGSGNATVNLGWEPQYVMFKRTDAGGEEWKIADMSRGFTANTGAQPTLWANLSNAEGNASFGAVTATGFKATSSLSASISFLAIRRPNKPPTSGTQVYNAISRTGTGAAATVTGVGFAPDILIDKGRTGARAPFWWDRLRGKDNYLTSSSTDPESTLTNSVALGQDGVDISGSDGWNASGQNYINHFFKRAHGVFDTVCYTGTGVAHTEAHGLGVVPELMIVKSRSAAISWVVYDKFTGPTNRMLLDSTAASLAVTANWNDTAPTAASFTVGTGGGINGSGSTHVAYLFASKPGISKVFSFTGNGTSQTINCGFAAGARFILIKRTDAAGDWYIWDGVRGIVAGNDPHLSLNATTAEVTTDDSIDPDASGFIVNQLAATNINVNGATYIGLAYA